MKKFIFYFVLFYCVSSIGQTINGKPLNELDVEYLSIIGTTKMMSSKLTITIDIGQCTKFFSSNYDTTLLKDENDKGIIFNSMIDALNFMSANGYEFVSSYVATVGGQNVFHYLMKRKQ